MLQSRRAYVQLVIVGLVLSLNSPLLALHCQEGFANNSAGQSTSAGERRQRFIEVFPAQPGSFEKRYPGLYRALESAEDLMQDFHYLVQDLGRVSVEEFIDRLLRVREQQAAIIGGMKHVFKNEHADIYEALNRAQEAIQMPQQSRQDFKYKLFDHRKTWIIDGEYPEEIHDQLMTAVHFSHGIIGELKVIMLVERVHAVNSRVEDLLASTQDIKRDLLDKEIDVVFTTGGNLVPYWGEVKNLRKVLEPNQISMRNILKQGKKTREVLDILGLHIEMHIFILRGLTKEAKSQLEKVGYRVHGQIRTLH